MSQTQHSSAVIEDTPTDASVDTHEKLTKAFAGFPSKATLEGWKLQVPGHRLRVFPLPDGKRVFVLRGLTALDFQALQAEALKVKEDRQEAELQILIAVRGQMWTNAGPGNKLTADDFRSSGAGLAQTVHLAVLGASDYVDPVAIEQLSFDI